jgi:hypothetical protein
MLIPITCALLLTLSQKRRKTAKVTLDTATIQKMKKIFQQIYAAVVATTDETGRKRCELFKDLPDKKVNSTNSSHTITKVFIAPFRTIPTTMSRSNSRFR